MIHGQERAVRELERLKIVGQGAFDFSLLPESDNGVLAAKISLRLGLMESRQGGLDLLEREEFLLTVPRDFPFDRPDVHVLHDRFAGFPHVGWKHYLCLYQSSLEWNPADGLFGFFDRLLLWLAQAAKNEMDPMEGPLEPPYYITDSSQATFVIRANAPVASGESWLGLAELIRYERRFEVVGWQSTFARVEDGQRVALALILPGALPMEFPSRGAEFFAELEKQGFDRGSIIRWLALAALCTPEGEPAHFLIGLPMRRAADGTPRLHIAVWAAGAEVAASLRQVIGNESDTEKLKELREELTRLLEETFSERKMSWCQVLEDRPEIVVRRDKDSKLAFFLDKRVLVLGCGALGSWAAEMVARAGAASLNVVDNGIVKPGLLARQNFTIDDVGKSKASALAERLRKIVPATVTIEGHVMEAHRYVLSNKEAFAAYDAVLDFTASHLAQMKLERDWPDFAGATPPFLTMVTDGQSSCGLFACLVRGSSGGPWDAYVRLKHELGTGDRVSKEFLDAFYDFSATRNLFQPEPGCSDPTFSGSTADAVGIVSTGLHAAIAQGLASGTSVAGAFTLPTGNKPQVSTSVLSEMDEIWVGNYRVRVSKKIHVEARAWVRQNSRLRTPSHETGGLLWGLWDEAVKVIWVMDASGPPPDSKHDPSHFLCGTEGTREEHEKRFARSRGTAGFIGFWHTHPDMESFQSRTDVASMAKLVSALGQNQKRSLMLIYGRTGNRSTAGLYAYESHSVAEGWDCVVASIGQFSLAKAVV